MEDFHGMKRKQLQALCKKHGVPANLTNREMADRLTLLLKEEANDINEVGSCAKNLVEIEDSKIVNKRNAKKVRFSPENETFVFLGSDSDSDSDSDKEVKRARRVGKVGKVVGVVGRTTQSRAQTQTLALAGLGKEECEEEPFKGPGRYALRRKSIVHHKPVSKKETRKQSRNVDMEAEASEIEPTEENEIVARKNQSIESLPVPEQPLTLRRSSRNASTNNSMLLMSNQVDVRMRRRQEPIRKQESSVIENESQVLTQKLSRRSTRNASKIDSDAELEVPDAAGDKIYSDSCCTKEISVEKRKGSKRKSIAKYALNSDLEKVMDTSLNTEGALISASVKLHGVSTGPSRSKPVLKKETRKRLRNADMEAEASEVEPTRENEIVERKKRSKESLPVPEQPLTLRRTSRNASTTDSMVIISNQVDGDGRMRRRRQKPIRKQEGSEIDSQVLTPKLPRRSTRNASKTVLVVSTGLAAKAVEEKQESKCRMSTEVGEAIGTEDKLAFDGPEIEITDSGLAVPDAAGDKIDSDSCCTKEISVEKRKVSTRKSIAKYAPHLMEVSAVNSDFEKVMDTSLNTEGALLSASLKLHGVSTVPSRSNSVSETIVNEKESILLGNAKGKLLLDDQSCHFSRCRDDNVDDNLVDPEPVNFQKKNKVSTVVSFENASPPFCQSDYSGETSNLLDLNKGLATQEALTSKNINVTSDKEDDQLAEDDKTSLEEDQNLEDANGIAEPIQEDLFIELGERSRCSNRKSELTSKKAGESSEFDPFEGEEIAQAVKFVEATEMQQIINEPHLLIPETSSERVTEIQLGTSGCSTTAATPLSLPPTIAALGSEVINHSIDTSSTNNDALVEEGNQLGAQTVVQSTMLGGEECYSYVTEIPDETMCRGENSVSNAGGGILSLKMTEPDVTIKENKSEEALQSERVVGEEIINEGSEGNLNMDGSIHPGLNNIGGQVAEENEVSEGNSDNFLDETRENFMNELPGGERICSIIPEEMITDIGESTSAAIIGLPSPVTVKKGISSSEHNYLKDIDEYERGPGVSDKKIFFCEHSLLIDNNMQQQKGIINLKDQFTSAVNDMDPIESGVALLQETKKLVSSPFEVADTADEKAEARSVRTDKNYENAKDDTKAGIEPVSLPHFALEELQGGEEKVEDVKDILDDILSQNKIGACSTESRAEVKVTSGTNGGNASMLETSAASNCSKLILTKLNDHEQEVSPDKVAHTVTMKRMDVTEEAELGRSLLPISPVGDELSYNYVYEYSETNVTAVGALNEVLPVDCEVLKEASNKDVQIVLQVGGKFGSLDDHQKEVALELDKSDSFVSDDHMSMDGKTSERNDNVGTVDGESNFKHKTFEFEDCTDAITHFTPDDIGGDLVDREYNVNDGDHNVIFDQSHEKKRVAADEAGAGSTDRKIDSENIDDGAKKVEKTPFSLQLSENGSNWDENNSKNVKFVADTSCGKPDMHSSSVYVSEQNVSSSHGDEFGSHVFSEGNCNDAKGKEMSDEGRGNNAIDSNLPFQEDDEVTTEKKEGVQKDNEGLKDVNVEENVTTSEEFAEEQLDGHKGEVVNSAFNGINCLTSNKPSCENGSKSNADKTEEALALHKLNNMVIRSDDSWGSAYFGTLHVGSSKKPEIGVANAVLSPVIALPSFGTVNKAPDFNFESEMLTSWEMNLILGDEDKGNVEISEANLISECSEDAMEVKENVRIIENAQQVAEMHHRDHEYHIHLAVSDELICEDGGRSNKQDDVAVIIQGHINCEDESIEIDSSYAFTHKVMLLEPDEVNGGNASSVRPMAECFPVGADVGGHPDEEKLLNVDDSDHIVTLEHSRVKISAATDEAGEVSTATKNGSADIKDANEWVEKTLISPHRFKSGSKGDEEKSAEVKISVGTSFARPEMGSRCTTVTLLDVPTSHGEEYECHVNSKFGMDVEGKEMANEDKGNDLKNLPKQEDDELRMKRRVEDNDYINSFSVDGNARATQVVAKDHLDDHEGVVKEAGSMDSMDCLAFNKPAFGNSSESNTEESEEAFGSHKLGDMAVSAEDSMDFADFKNWHILSSSNHEAKALELNAESQLFTSWEMNSLWGDGVQDEVDKLDAGASVTNLRSENIEDTKEVKDLLVIEQVAEEQHGDLNCTHNAVSDEPMCEKSDGSKDRSEVSAIKGSSHATADEAMEECDPNDSKEAENIASAGAEDIKFSVNNRHKHNVVEAMELSKDASKISATTIMVEKSPASTNLAGGGDKKYKTSLIPRTPKTLLKTHDMKENMPITKSGQVGNITASKTSRRRRPLQDI